MRKINVFIGAAAFLALISCKQAFSQDALALQIKEYAKQETQAAADQTKVIDELRKKMTELFDSSRSPLMDAAVKKALDELAQDPKLLAAAREVQAAHQNLKSLSAKLKGDLERQISVRDPRLKQIDTSLRTLTTLSDEIKSAAQATQLKAQLESELVKVGSANTDIGSLTTISQAQITQYEDSFKDLQAAVDNLKKAGNFGSGTGGSSMVQEMAAMNMQFLALQQALQAESRKFQTLSNASKARHDVIINTIRNLK